MDAVVGAGAVETAGVADALSFGHASRGLVAAHVAWRALALLAAEVFGAGSAEAVTALGVSDVTRFTCDADFTEVARGALGGLDGQADLRAGAAEQKFFAASFFGGAVARRVAAVDGRDVGDPGLGAGFDLRGEELHAIFGLGGHGGNAQGAVVLGATALSAGFAGRIAAGEAGRRGAH